MKDKLNKLIKSDYFVWIVFIIIESVMIFLVNPIYRDDTYFSKLLNEGKTIIDITIYRYNTWTSRSIIEAVLIFISSKPRIVWQIIQIFMTWVLAYSISRIFTESKNRKIENILIFSLILTYPMFNFSAAGWEATSINYVWPMALGIFSFIFIKKVFEKSKISLIEYILYSISIVFACNMEQMCIVILGIYIIYTLIYCFINKKIHPFFIIQILISILSLIFIFTCKGNFVRQQSEMIRYLEYPNLSLFDKLGMTFTTTMNDYLNWSAFPISILCIVLPIYICSNYKEKAVRIISLIPAMILIPFKYFSTTFYNIFPDFERIKMILTNRSAVINCESSNDIYAWTALIISIIFFVSIFISLILIYDDIKKNNALIVFLVGMVSKFMLVFTSSIFASAPRTIMYFDFSIYIVIFLIMQELLKKNDKLFTNTLIGIQVLGIYQFINNMILIINGLN